MMVIENVIAKIVTNSPDGVELNVVAHLIPGSRIASKIDYTLTINHFEFPFVFDGQQTHKPHLSNNHVVEKFFDIFVIGNKQRKSPSPISTIPMMLFSKSEQSQKINKRKRLELSPYKHKQTPK